MDSVVWHKISAARTGIAGRGLSAMSLQEAYGAGSPGAGHHGAGVKRKRMWRVGSMTAGVVFVLMGVILAVSLWTHVEAHEALSWIGPVIFILLGIEVLLYLRHAGSDQVIVRYDWLSILTIGIVSVASIVLSLLISTGIYDELQRGMSMMQRSAYVELEPMQVPKEVETIVVHSLSHLEIYRSNTRQLQLFGQVRYWSDEPLDLEQVNLLQTNTVGSTMHVMVGTIERRDAGLYPTYVDSQLTLVVPEEVEIIRR